MFKVYILQSVRNGRYYIGSTQAVATRVAQHNAGKVRSTRHIRPLELVYSEPFENRAAARRREAYLKRLKSRKAIEELVIGRGR